MSALTQRRKHVRAILAETPYAKWADVVAANVTLALYLERCADDGSVCPVGSSKLGGLPDLLRPWPVHNGKALYFIGQFNLSEVSLHDEDHLLPKTGLLSFFLELNDEKCVVVHEPDYVDFKRTPLPVERLEEEWADPPERKIRFNSYYNDNLGMAYQRRQIGELEDFQAIYKLVEAHQSDADVFHYGDRLLGSDDEMNMSSIETHECQLLSVVDTGESWPFFGNMAYYGVMFVIPSADLEQAKFDRVRLMSAIS